MKIVKMIMMALVFGCIAFAFTGCGFKSESTPNSDSPSPRAVAEAFIKERSAIEKFSFDHEAKVSDNYVMLCYYLRENGKSKEMAFHVVKKDGKWTVAEAENNWAVKNRYK